MLNFRFLYHTALSCLLVIASHISLANNPALSQLQSMIGQNLPSWERTYRHLHANPELSLQEQETAQYLATKMRELGFMVTENVGGHGVVAMLENGEGPVVMVRTDMDALPIQETTGLPYASQVMADNAEGETVPVMHACGHDLHMAAWLGTATVLQELHEQWQGTIIFVAQPAEEILKGAEMMLKSGLYVRFPQPDYVLALHSHAHLPTGSIGYNTGYVSATSDLINITVYGEEGHAAMPQNTIDPIVLSARIVLALQTIISREIDPADSAVLTVSSIQGGDKGNIIPGKVELTLSLRTFESDVRQYILAAIERVAEGVAYSAGVSKNHYPIVEIARVGVPSIYNDPDLTHKIMDRLRPLLGEEQVVQIPPSMISEDFSQYRYVHGKPVIPQLMYSLGTADPERYQDYLLGKADLPGLHTGHYHPWRSTTSIAMGVLTMSLAVMDLAPVVADEAE